MSITRWTRLREKDTALLLLLSLLVLLPAAWLRPPSRQQELRVLISARNMLVNRDWIRPEFQNQPRFRKPPLPYWMSAVSMGLSGQRQSAFVGRLPFVGATLGLLFILQRLAGTQGALFALFSYGVWRYGVAAETDMINLMGITLAVAAWQRQQPGWSGLGMSLAVLSKGPSGVVIPLVLFVLPPFRRGHPARHWAAAFVPPLCAAAAWTLFLWLDPMAREALRQEIRDTFVDSPHRKFILYYVWIAPLILFPWSPAFLRRSVWLQSSVPARVWFAVTFVLLTLTVSKQNHYALLFLPAGVWMLSAAGLRIPRPAWMLPALVLLLAGGEVFRYLQHPPSRHMRFLREARKGLPAEIPLHVYGINSAVFDFHLGAHVLNTNHPLRAIHAARDSGGAAVLIFRRRENLPPLPEGFLDQSDAQWIRRVYRFSENPAASTAASPHPGTRSAATERPNPRDLPVSRALPCQTRWHPGGRAACPESVGHAFPLPQPATAAESLAGCPRPGWCFRDQRA